MTDRKWRIISEKTREIFYEKVNKYELEGYELIPESFSVSDASNNGIHFNCLMKNKK